MRTEMRGENLVMEMPSDRELAWTRVFNAPRALVFDALTKPELLRRWLLGPEGWTMPICEVDLRVGGKYRYVWNHPENGDMGISGIYKEISPTTRIVNTERFDDPWYTGEALVTTVLEEVNNRTTLRTTMLMESKEARDGVLASGMDKGLTVSYNNLAAILAEVA